MYEVNIRQFSPEGTFKGVDGFRCDAAGEMLVKFWNAGNSVAY